MSLSPAQFRLAAGVAIFVVFGGAILWVSRVPVRPRRGRPTPPSVGVSRGAMYSGNATIEGTVVGPDGKPARADVSVVIENPAQPMRGGTARGRRTAVTRTTDDGQFTLNVSAGHVIVVARAVAEESTEAGGWWAAAEATPSSGAHVATTLKLQRSGGVAGSIQLLGRAGVSGGVAGTIVSLEPANADAKAVLLDGAPRVAAGADGHFVMPDLPPGEYRLIAEVAAPWLVDRVSVNGQEGLDQPISVVPGGFLRDAIITATDVPNELDGSVVDAAGHAVPFGLVFAFAADPADRAPARRLQATRTNRDGHFTLTGLPSGDYLVGLSAGAEPGTWYSPAFLAGVAKGATPVRVVAGTTHATVVAGRQ